MSRPMVSPAPAEFSSSSQVSGEHLERSLESGLDARHRGLQPVAAVRADVEADIGADLRRDARGVHERVDRLLVDLVVQRRQVDEVDRVADGVGDARLGRHGAELEERGRVVIRRLPLPRALREDLDRVAAEVDAAPDRVRDPSCHRDVRAVEHRPRTIGRRWMSGSASAPRRPGTSTSGRSHRPLQLAVRAPPRRRRVLRIEDTDQSREAAGAIEQIQESLDWLGLDFDESPAQRRPVRPVPAERAARRVPRGRGAAGRRRPRVPCFQTPEELEAARATARETDDPAVADARRTAT